MKILYTNFYFKVIETGKSRGNLQYLYSTYLFLRIVAGETNLYSKTLSETHDFQESVSAFAKFYTDRQFYFMAH